MFSMRSSVAALGLVLAAGGAMLGQASAAVAADGPGGIPALVVSPAPGKLTKEQKVTETYKYDPQGSGSSSQPPASSTPPPAPEPGPVTNLKDTASSAVQSVTSGAGATVDSALK
ncbi:hypothetical protein GCM10010145_48720 [Streptomyces ruber]|uniref:Uncharacterized protein n=2 Tax=Streptomyces TaxID=1883 RepID=A0A918BKH8_9ACTN|nr:hypothetical protein [Streptomyces ruber]GGQ73224.1 hypothetical protein GCM10010145_48720 [Streptomyces ruber]